MERIAHKARSFEEADAWDRAQHRALTPEERLENAAELRRRVYGADALDVRAAERAARLRT